MIKQGLALGFCISFASDGFAAECPSFTQQHIDTLLNGMNVVTAQGTYVLKSHNDVRDNIKHELENAKKRHHTLRYTCKITEDGLKLIGMDEDQKLFSLHVAKLQN